jgi:uncharacterized damage-inducible protein DinB
MNSVDTQAVERQDLLETLAKHRFFLRYTVRDLSDEQAASRPTASELCLGGIIKHVAEVESSWVDFIVDGPREAMSVSEDALNDPAIVESWKRRFHMESGETLASLLQGYQEVAQRTEDVVAGLADLDQSRPLPEAPWFEAGASWTARRTLLHIIAETAQHAGHADIIRETLDGSKTMG